jgi:hypothetical protein
MTENNNKTVKVWNLKTIFANNLLNMDFYFPCPDCNEGIKIKLKVPTKCKCGYEWKIVLFARGDRE